MSSGDGLPSQTSNKPTFTEIQASALVESVFGFKVSKIQPLPSYDDQNFHVCISRTKDSTGDPVEYVLKISNTESSQTPDLIEMQNHVIMFLRAAGFPTPSVCRTKGDNTISLMSIGKRSLYHHITAFWLQAWKWFELRSSINSSFLFINVLINSNWGTCENQEDMFCSFLTQKDCMCCWGSNPDPYICRLSSVQLEPF